MVARCLGGHWSVVVAPVVSASPMRSSGRCYPRSRTVQAGDTIVLMIENEYYCTFRAGRRFFRRTKGVPYWDVKKKSKSFDLHTSQIY